MPLFRYQALSTLGKTVKGVIDADSLSAAKEKVRKDQLLVIDVRALSTLSSPLKLPSSLLLSFTRELAQLLKAGLPLYESLLTIEEKYRRHRAHPLFLDLADRLKEGSSLSSALKRYSSTFSPIYLSMVKVAEESAQLAFVFQELAELIARQQTLKKQLSSALIYPAFLALFCGAIILGLLFFVIPSMQELFEDRTLHPVTALVLGASHFANAYALPLFFTALTLLTALVIALRSESCKLKLYTCALTLPFIKTLLLDSALVRFCRSLSLLLTGGIPLLDALSLARAVVKSPLLEASIQQAQTRVAQGEKLSVALSAPGMPPLLVRMLSLSEETGKMQEAFAHLAAMYDEEMEKNLHQLTTFLQPALLIALGAIVGLVVLSILLPLTDVSGFTH